MRLFIKSFQVELNEDGLVWAEHIPTGRDVTSLVQDIDWETIYRQEKIELDYERYKLSIERCSFLSDETKEALL